MRTREGFVSSVPPFETRADAFTTEMMRPVHPPRRYLAIAAVLALASIVCWVLASSAALSTARSVLAVSTAGYVLATFFGLGAAAMFTREDLRRRQSRLYSPDRRLGPLRTVIVVTCVGAAAANVWRLATLLAS